MQDSSHLPMTVSRPVAAEGVKQAPNRVHFSSGDNIKVF